jgi:hypothetical protein
LLFLNQRDSHFIIIAFLFFRGGFQGFIICHLESKELFSN